MKITLGFLKLKEIKNINEVVNWLNNKGGYCDCEVLANVVEMFDKKKDKLNLLVNNLQQYT